MDASEVKFELYRTTAQILRIYMPDGHYIEFNDSWCKLHNPDYIRYMNSEIDVLGFGKAVWKASEAEYAEYEAYSDPTMRSTRSILSSLMHNPELALTLADALRGSEDKRIQALQETLEAGGTAGIKSKITVGGNRPQLQGIGNSSTIASTAAGSVAGEDAAVVPKQ